MFYRKINIYLLISALVSLLASLPASAKIFKLATVSPDGLGWMQKLRAGTKEIEQQTEARVKFKIYPGGVQGDDFTVLRKMRIGQLQGGVVASGSLTRFYPDLQVYSLPLSFKTGAEVDYVRQRMDQTLIQGLDENGIMAFHFTETGFAYLLSQQPVQNLADLQKMKTWVPGGDPIVARLSKSFGVSPIPLYITDVLVSLQTGLIDTVIVPPIVALALQWHNHMQYVTSLPLVYTYSMLILDKEAFTSITAADQLIIREVMDRVFFDVGKNNRIDNIKAYEALLNQGLQEVTLSAADLVAWQTRAMQAIIALVASGEISRQSVDTLTRHLTHSQRAVTP